MVEVWLGRQPINDPLDLRQGVSGSRGRKMRTE